MTTQGYTVLGVGYDKKANACKDVGNIQQVLKFWYFSLRALFLFCFHKKCVLYSTTTNHFIGSFSEVSGIKAIEDRLTIFMKNTVKRFNYFITHSAISPETKRKKLT